MTQPSTKTAMTVVDPPADPAPVAIDLSMTRTPETVLEEARRAAVALTRVIDAKPHPVILSGEKYLELEDWLTVARFYAVAPKVVETRYVEYGDIRGFEAKAVALRADGIELSAAEASCLTDEPRWRSRPVYEWRDTPKGRRRFHVRDEPVPLFMLKSMAQTRACAKVLRNVCAWIVVLAGYKPTPAEELQLPVEGGDPISPAASKPERTKATVKGKATKGRRATTTTMPTPAGTFGSFGPAAIARVEERRLGDGSPVWWITTVQDEHVFTRETSFADTLRPYAGRPDAVRLAWELTQAGQKTVHRLVRILPPDAEEPF